MGKRAIGLVLCLLLGAALSACGGGESNRKPAAAKAASGVPAADRIAYYQLATTAGFVRSAAIAAAHGQRLPARAGDSELAAAAGRVARLDPRDGVLKLVRARVTRLLAEARAGFRRGSAQEALVELRSIDRALNRYVRFREPAQVALIPD